MSSSAPDHEAPLPPPIESIGNAQRTSDPTTFKPDSRLYLAFTGLLVMTLMVALEGTIVSVAIATIATDLQSSPTEAFWIGTAYLLTSTLFQPITASLSYAFGRRLIIMGSLVLFGLGSIVCALAQNLTAMLAGRSVQGIGGAGIITMTEIVLTDLIPLQKRGTYTGILASMYALGGGVGPILGGALAGGNWRWIFWINLPFVAAAGVLVWSFLRLNHDTASIMTKLRQCDWLGMVLFIGGTTSLLIPLSWGGVQEPWSSWRTLLPLILGIVGTCSFGIYSVKSSKTPLIPCDIFPNRSANLGYVNSCLQGLLMYCLLYFLPLYLEGVREFSTIRTGVFLLPFTLGIAPAAALTGFLITKLGSYRWSIWLAWSVTTLGLGLLLLLKVDTALGTWILIVLVGAIGTGISAPALMFQVQASQCNQKTVGLAISMYSFTRSMGQALGVAIGGNIFQNRVQVNLRSSSVGLSNVTNNAIELVQVIRSTPPGDRQMTLRGVYVDSLRSIWLFTTIVSAVALLLSLPVKAYPMDVPLETDQAS